MGRGGFRTGAGRRPGTAERTAVLHVRVEPEQLERYRAIAEARGLSISAWVATVLDRQRAPKPDGHGE